MGVCIVARIQNGNPATKKENPLVFGTKRAIIGTGTLLIGKPST